MSRAGHSDFKTTQGYIDLAGETFREEADRLERRLWGTSVQSSGTTRLLRTPSRRRRRRNRLNGAAQESNLPSVGLRRRTGFEGLLSEAWLATEAAFWRRFGALRPCEVR
jgi:hypothetical protein